ncbi:unnamed protein product [Schistosoma haematobium]|nr:unnamed protein product [Schistosoma haematobium]CAH8636651.1 unnamed protein product [Schistosoma haematobium]
MKTLGKIWNSVVTIIKEQKKLHDLHLLFRKLLDTERLGILTVEGHWSTLFHNGLAFASISYSLILYS